MSNNLTGSTLLTKGDLLHVSNSGSGIDSTSRTVYDGAGNASALTVSTTTVTAANISISGNTITTSTGALTLNSYSGTVSLGTTSTGTVNIGTGTGCTLTLGNSSGTTQINGTVTFGGAVSYADLTLSGTLTAATTTTTALNVNGFAITMTGALTRVGAHTLTLTTSATTNATLPAGTTTLVTTTGTGATGTWGISISGNAATVTTNANLTGDVTSSGNATTLANSTVTAAKVAANSGVGIPVQVVFDSMTSTANFATSTFTNTSLAASITPTASTSKILVQVVMYFGMNASDVGFARIVRGSTAIGVGDVAGNRIQCGGSMFPLAVNAVYPLHLSWIDSPATTSSTTYTVQVCSNSGNTCYINQTQTDSNTTSYPRCVSTITLMEIK